MKKTIILLIELLIVSVLVSATALAYNSEINKLLAQTRAATAKYHNVDSAIADGYVSTVECVESPPEVIPSGVMGIHYINLALFDCTVDELEPEILLYVPTKNGFRLVGVEYFIPSFCVESAPVPVLFGQEMDGPMLGHGEGQPPHYDLHVWLWQANPEGIFEEWNPKLSC